LGSPSQIEEALRALALPAGAPGWSPEEWAEHLAEPLPDAPPLPARVEGVVLCAPHPSELALAPLARVRAYLERGERVLLAIPPEIPALGEVWTAGLAGASGWTLMEDDRLGALRGALARSEVRAFDASGPPARVAELAELARGCEGRVQVGLRELRNTSLCVRRADDAEELARSAANMAFGRVAALSGQRAGALGRVVCHERSFSRFSGALLAELERGEAFARPVPLLEKATRAHVSAAWTLGLDEGATPVLVSGEGMACVFTNVDERMRLASLARCAPLLVLLRAGSDEEAAVLAAQLDGDSRALDLA
jgi:hypothetical protein